jgi:hypothetical protein
MLHPFETAGLGLAPFSYAGMSEKTYAPDNQPGGTCDFCGNGIRYCCHIRSADGKSFIVGTDCVRRLESEDNRLLTAVERDVAEREQVKRTAKRQAKWEADRLARESELQSQRDRNGGLTDWEIGENARLQAERELEAKMTAANGWLLEILAGDGSFIQDMAATLRRNALGTLSDGQFRILRDIYGKAKGGRRNSKAYAKAVADFDSRT